ncbi:MAG TPA: hypothetical protein DCG57_08725 [Candidatus Riflebacteria bacterium]|jgi:TPR repeat protein|nr:hypothetical protein [Candidatus Riflebacteria bacterium]
MEITDTRKELCVCGGHLKKLCDSPIRVSAPYAPQDEVWTCQVCAKFFMKTWRAGNIDYYTEKADYVAVFDELKPALKFCLSCKGARETNNPIYFRQPVCIKCFILKEWEEKYSRREVEKKFPSDTELSNFLAGMRAFDDRSYPEALEKLKPFAEMGFALAEYKLGEIFEKDYEDWQNLPVALEWFSKAARRCFSQAFLKIGKLFSENHKIGINLSEAYKWFNLGAYFGEFQCVAARDNMAAKLSYEEVLQAQEESVFELRKYWNSSDLRRRIADTLKKEYGELEGTFRYASVLEGTAFQTFILEYRESEKLYRNLAEDRYTPAMCRLGEKLARGSGIPVNLDEAAQWLSTAVSRDCLPAIDFAWGEVCAGSALKLEREWLKERFLEQIENGDAKAMYSWGTINFKGRGVPEHFEEAHKWLNLAQYFGVKLPRPSPLETIEREISFDQLERTLKATQQWLEEHQGKIRSIAKDLRNLRDRVMTSGTGKWFILGESFHYGGEGYLRHVMLAYGCFDLAHKAGESAATSRLEYLKRILTSARIDNAVNMTADFAKTGRVPV